MTGLSVFSTTRKLRLTSSGRLQPWLGPALRGLAGHAFRERTCEQPLSSWSTEWQYCGGCPFMRGCGYGETYEPDAPAGVRVAAGWEQGARPLVIAPEFPVGVQGESGEEITVKVLFIGEKAGGHASLFWESLGRAGADIRCGLGEDRVLFDVLPHGQDEWTQITLPASGSSDEAGPEAMLEIEFVSPLFVMQQEKSGRRKVCSDPSFFELTRAGLRTLGPLLKLYGESLPESVFREVKEAAVGIPRLEAAFMPFTQWKSSYRTKTRVPLKGVIGRATFGPVPHWLSEWIRHAGQLHVGTHRVAGAGGWRTRMLRN